MLHKSIQGDQVSFFYDLFRLHSSIKKNQRYYYGQTQNLVRRLDYHNTGKSVYTRNFIPWILVAYLTVETRSEAVRYEKMLKNLHSKSKVFAFIARHNFIITDKN